MNVIGLLLKCGNENKWSTNPSTIQLILNFTQECACTLTVCKTLLSGMHTHTVAHKYWCAHSFH